MGLSTPVAVVVEVVVNEDVVGLLFIMMLGWAGIEIFMSPLEVNGERRGWQ